MKPDETKLELRCTQPPVISENLSEMSTHVAAIFEQVKALPKTPESVSTVKALRADLRRQFESLEDQRKAVKKAVLAPFEQAEAVYKERISEPVKKADAFLKCWIEDVQNEQKAACRQKLMAYFDELSQSLGVDFVTFDRCGVTVDMATANQKEPRKAFDAIYAFLTRISNDITAIAGMEYAEEILAAYKNTLSVADAIRIANQRRSDIAKAKWALEDSRAEMERAAQQCRIFEEAVPEVVQPLEKKFSATFTVTDTTPRLRALKAFLDGNNYTYEED